MNASSMRRLLCRTAFLLCLLAFALSGPRVAANPIGDFFKNVGRSISNLGKKTPPKTKAKKSKKNSGTKSDDAESTPPDMTPSPTPVATPSPTPPPLEIRPAAIAPPDRLRSRDLPYAVRVPNRPGLVTSPYAPDQGYVDVSEFPSSTEVMDPFTGKVFLTP